MAYASPSAWYSNYGNGTSTGYYAVNAWATGVSTPPGTLIRQATLPTVGNERVFVSAPLVTDTASHNTGTEPVWVVTKGAQNTDGLIHWQECTGQPGLNGDTTNSPQWTTGSTPSLGLVIYDPTSGSLQICSTSGAGGSVKPTFSATAGTVTTDTSAKWTSLGLASGFSIWKAPFARLQSAFATNWETSGALTFVSAAHAETQSTAMTLTSPGTSAAVTSRVVCVLNAPATTPPGSADVTTGASVSSTLVGGTPLTIQPANGGSIYYEGITFNCGSGTSGALCKLNGNPGIQILENCQIVFGNTLGTSDLYVQGGANNGSLNRFINTTVQFSTVASSIAPGGFFEWWNTPSAIAGAVIPTGLFNAGNADAGVTTLTGVDLSAMGAGDTIVPALLVAQSFRLINCKLGASVTVAAAPGGPGEATTDVVFSDSAGTNYQVQRYWYEGTLLPSTTVVRTGGASLNGTPVSWNITTTANVTFNMFFRAPPSWIYNPTTGSPVAVIIYGIWFGSALPNNDQVWHDVEYMGASGNPLASLGSGTKANTLATGSAWAADTAAWDSAATARLNSTVYAVGNIFSQSGSPGSLFIVTAIGSSPHQSAASPPAGYTSATDGASFADGNLTVQAAYRFKMSVFVTPQLAGFIQTYIKAALASSTYYIDPQVVL